MKYLWTFFLLACSPLLCLAPPKHSKKNDKQEMLLASSQEYWLEDAHPAKSVLDTLFNEHQVLESISHASQAGFMDIAQRSSGMRVLAHPNLAGYLLKLYPINEKNNASKDLSWALKRCYYAKQIRELISIRKLSYFCVPMKWIYIVPNQPELSQRGITNYAVLVVEDMQIESRVSSQHTWAHLNSTEVIDELYAIFKCGYSSCRLPVNMPMTKNGKFACIDTESQKIDHRSLGRACKYLSTDMQAYFKQLIRTDDNDHKSASPLKIGGNG